MRPPEILTKARELISDPVKWTKYYYARDKAGDQTDPDGEEAVCWCALGAIRKVLGSRTDYSIASGFLAHAMPKGVSIDIFNDDSQTTHEDVLKAFDRAIELAKAEEDKP